jgi:hypothetical protein
MTFRLQPTYEQTVDLERLLEDQQNPSNPLFHAWLTPEEYAERFGLNRSDFAKVREWIASQGFQIQFAAKSRTYITFSGTAAQVREVFGTELHRFTVGGKRHFANVREALVPKDLEPLIATLRGLDDFRMVSRVRGTRRATEQKGSHAMSPGDAAIIYNAAALHKKGITGKGQRVAVAGITRFNIDDVRSFRKRFGLGDGDLKIALVEGSDDPGTNDDEVPEALLDVEWAGALAPDATIVYVYGTDPWDAASYAVDQNLAPVVSLSYGGCEPKNSEPSLWKSLRNTAQQAAAQGITWLAASGDSGAADCEDHGESAGVRGMTVDIPASVPEVTAVGGTEFADGTGTYWSPNNSDTLVSALSYIPETSWNDTASTERLEATGGGSSTAFPRPSWQTGPGVPEDNARHVPDVAFTASGFHVPYVAVVGGELLKVGGTSASTPLFAGALALLNQYVVSNGHQAKPGLGNINPRLYELAQTTKGVFHDITSGDNIVPCKSGTPDCKDGKYGHKAGPGYDMTTGLGSLDIANFTENYPSTKRAPKTGSGVTISVEPSRIYKQAPDGNGYTWHFAVNITETAGAKKTILALMIDDIDISDSIEDLFGSASLGANQVLSAKIGASGFDFHSDHQVIAGGADDRGKAWVERATFTVLGSQSPGENTKGAALSLTSDPAVVVKIGRGDPNCPPNFPYGQVLTIKELNGTAVKLTKFLAGGDDFTSKIVDWWGIDMLPAAGTLRSRMCWQIDKLPMTLSYEVDGVDAAGKKVQATLNVDFKDPLDAKGGGITGGDRTSAIYQLEASDPFVDVRATPLSPHRAGAVGPVRPAAPMFTPRGSKPASYQDRTSSKQ